jgi:hypothetical protein
MDVLSRITVGILSMMTVCVAFEDDSGDVIPHTSLCHSRESGNPGIKESGSPIKLGMTVTMDSCLGQG